MSNPVIRAENLGKRYILGQVAGGESYTALRDVIARSTSDLAARVFRRKRPTPANNVQNIEEFWALKDVTFTVAQGDVVGVIGRNGAGKSTLLKILSRISDPSTGRITLDGRVSSLLEVGTGFHPELTGRENIYLNGAILGMTRAEVRRKFDEIIDFAGVERFLDTPVKRYSSGMYVRLAFAVAAHLEPEILVIDEVLAVGDTEFQKRCLGKIEEVASGGRTVLFVSHNIDVVQRFCQSAICLDRGQITHQGNVGDVVNNYLSATSSVKAELDVAFSGFVLSISPPVLEIDRRMATLDITLTSSDAVRFDELCVVVLTITGTRVGIMDLRCSAGLDFGINEPAHFSIVFDHSILNPSEYDLVIWARCPGGFRVVDLGRIFLGSRQSGSESMTLYPAQINGVVSFRGEVVRHRPAEAGGSSDLGMPSLDKASVSA
jgi:lipopolysaccharide transport system ATP-binding protein